jgi:peptidyl-prolyl cis-trans isomerase A (cyclophilin A)
MNFLKRSILARQRLLIFVLLAAVVVSCDHPAMEKVLMRTEMGDITLEIYPDKAPVTASNFLALVDQGVYTNAVFYRVVRMDNQPQNKVKIEVIQGGLFNDSLINNFTPIEHESTGETGILHTDGVISMARMEPGTASTEFFICVGNQPSLDYGGDRNPDGEGFAAFGRVSEGMDVVRKIQILPDSGQYLPDKVLINSMQKIR